MHKLHYNIHNFLNILIQAPKNVDISDINREFLFFKIKNIDNANDMDIVFNIGKFKPLNNDCYLVDHKYYIKEGYIYYKGSEGKTEWQIEINGLESGTIFVNLYSTTLGIKNKILTPNFLIKDLLLRVIEYKLGEKRAYLIHSAGISKNKKAYIFIGRGGTHKTTIVMDFIRRQGFKLLGDDHVIIRGDTAYSFPENLPIFEFMLNNLESEDSWRLRDKFRFLGRLIFDMPNNIEIKYIEEQSTIGAIFFLTKRKGLTVPVMTTIDPATAVDKVIPNNIVDDFISLQRLGIYTGLWTKLILSYSYVFPNSRIARFYELIKKDLTSIFKEVPIYQIDIPTRYTIDTFRKIQSLIVRGDRQ